MAVEKNIVEEQLRALGEFHGLLTKKELRFLPRVMAEGEVIHAVTSGFYEGKSWIVVMTDMRLLFLDRGLLFGVHQIDMPLAQVSSVSQKIGIIFGSIEVATSGGKRVIERIPCKDVTHVTSILAALVHGKKNKSAGPRCEELGSQLEKICELWRQGALTDAEFDRAKTRLIGS